MTDTAPFSDHQIQLVQESFAKVAPNADQAGMMFYTRLFELDPALKPMFKGDIQSQSQKLMATLGVAVSSLTNLEELVPILRQMGIQHVPYGVKPEHYDTVGEALLWTLDQGLGDDYTPELAEAWTAVYTTVADVMKDAAYPA